MHLLHRSSASGLGRGARPPPKKQRLVVAVSLARPPSTATFPASTNDRRRRARAVVAARASADDADDLDDDLDDDEDDRSPLPPLPPPADPAAADAAALLAVDSFVRPGAIVGVGRGELVQRVLAAIGRRIAEGRLGNVSVLPSGDAAAAAAAFHGVPLAISPPAGQPPHSPAVFFDEADQLDAAANAYLSGSRAGEAAHPDLPAVRALVERTLARGGEVVALAPSAGAVVARLNAALPVALAGAAYAVADDAGPPPPSSSASPASSAGPPPPPPPASSWEEAAEALDDLFLGDAELWRRPQDPRESANPRGGRAPLVQPDGTTIVDVRFYEGLCLFGDADAAYSRIQLEIEAVGGVVATGLFVGKATAAVVPAAGGGGDSSSSSPRLLVRGAGGALLDAASPAKKAAAA